MRDRVGNANEMEIKKKKIQIERFATRFVDRSNRAAFRERDGLEDAMDRGALDKRGDMGLIAAFTLTAHQSRSTTSLPHPYFSFSLFPSLSPPPFPPSLSLLLLCTIRKRENR